LNFLEKNDCAGFDGEYDEALVLVKEILHGDTEKITTTKHKVLSPDTIPGSELLPLLLPLHSTPVNQWSDTDVVLLAQKLSKGGCVDGFSSKDNRKGSLMLEDISDGLNLFASRNKDIQELLDPFFVCFVHPLHAKFNASVIAYPVGGSPVAAPVATPIIAPVAAQVAAPSTSEMLTALNNKPWEFAWEKIAGGWQALIALLVVVCVLAMFVQPTARGTIQTVLGFLIGWFWTGPWCWKIAYEKGRNQTWAWSVGFFFAIPGAIIYWIYLLFHKQVNTIPTQ
jgi:hypothetical protein